MAPQLALAPGCALSCRANTAPARRANATAAAIAPAQHRAEGNAVRASRAARRRVAAPAANAIVASAGGERIP